MADTQTTVTNLDIQLLDADRSNTVTIKLDNPKNNVTREQVSAAMQPALTNGWFLNSKGDTIMYLGDVTINQSIKTKLGGEDFYVTPDSITMVVPLNNSASTTVTVTGATIQGFNFANVTNNDATYTAKVADNGLSVTLTIKQNTALSDGTFDFILIIQGTQVVIPVSFSSN